MGRLALIVLLSAPLLSGCIPIPYKGSTWVEAPLDQKQSPSDAEGTIKLHDAVRVRYRKSGRVDEFEVVELNDEGFIGIAWDHKRYRLSYAEASDLWVERSRWRVFTLCAKVVC